jgi:alpha-L-fucosidase
MAEQAGRFSRRAVLAGALGAAAAPRGMTMVDDPRLPVPTPEQLAWQEAELSVFFHFGVNTFTNREWGEGTEDPAIFNPESLDAEQWVDAAKQAGFKYLILTAKHHDGFCLWPSRHTKHSVAASPWRGGKGDVLGDFAKAVHAAKLKLGIYISPWDRHEPCYGDSPAYNKHFVAQLDEALTRYGEVGEVWFDGACGEGPNGKRQEYAWDDFYATVRKRQPKALIAICGPDIRWVGNEDGYARETEWSIQPAPNGARAVVDGKAWWPAECDVSIRPGWFWHPAEDARVKPLDHLLDIYFRSVGRNSMLLLNVPPNRHGVLADPDVARLAEFGAAVRRMFGQDLARGKRVTASAGKGGALTDGRPSTHWSVSGGLPASAEVDLGSPVTFDVVCTQEQVSRSQRVEAYRVEARVDGEWRTLVQGTTIGRKKLDRMRPVTADRVRLTLEKALAPPMVTALGLYRTGAPGTE